MIQALETKYGGHRFRSRLEARWAVFFDSLKIKWEYEPQGYKLSSGDCYLPDFFLPAFNGGLFVEVKPEGGDLSKPIQFAADSERPILLAVGAPQIEVYPVADTNFWGVYFDGAIFLDKYILHEQRLFRGYGGDPTHKSNIFDYFVLWDNPCVDEAVKASRNARFEETRDA